LAQTVPARKRVAVIFFAAPGGFAGRRPNFGARHLCRFNATLQKNTEAG
jgi:hypothetical protein